ncbi:GIY-YIG nuclease family protein [bacterium]|nr:GIY-YIG nuclease family protein [bacterium]
MSDPDLDELAEELSEFELPDKVGGRSPREERIIVGFEDIQRFVTEHGRVPLHGEDRDIFERLYAVRLDRLRGSAECRAILASLDHGGLLGAESSISDANADLSVDELAEALEGVDSGADITELRHVRTAADKRAAEEIANRDKCEDFETFRPMFEKVQAELASGVRESRQFKRDTEILPGQFFILGGQKAYVHELGTEFETPEGRTNRRMRVIFDNGTESNALLRSFQRALYKPENHGRRITEPAAGPLFADSAEDDDLASGTIYVLRSKSSHPVVAAHRDIVHKIGVTSGDIKRRLSSASLDPTFLMADVDVVATYELFNISRRKFEALIHRVFGAARLDIEITDRFGNPVVPREWFLVPLFVINEAFERIRDGSITELIYDPASAALVRAEGRREDAR